MNKGKGKKRPPADGADLADVLAKTAERLAMARAVLVVRGPDGREQPVGAVVSMPDLLRMAPRGSADDVLAELERSKVAADQQQFGSALRHLTAALEHLLRLLGA